MSEAVLKDDQWHDVNHSNSSPVERDRDRQIERAIVKDGRPLSALAIVAQQHGAWWAIEVLSRDALLERLDTRGRTAKGESDRELCKALAAWIRGLDPDTCPELFTWEDGDGGRSVQRATIERASGTKGAGR